MIKIIIIALMSIVLFCGCSSSLADIDQQTSTVTTSYLSSSDTSENMSTSVANVSSNVTSETTGTNTLSRDEGEKLLKEKGAFFSVFHQHDGEIVLNDKIAERIDNLIFSNTYLCTYYFYLRAREYDDMTEINENLYQYNVLFELDDLKKRVYDDYSEDEANRIVNEPYNGIKRYHYFEKNGEYFLDKTVANATPNKEAENGEGMYDYSWYSFNYESVDETHMNIDLFIFGSYDNNIYKLPLKAVLENGEWKLEKMVFEESVVPVG